MNVFATDLMLSSEAYYCINQSLKGFVSQIIKACVANKSNLKQAFIVGQQFNKNDPSSSTGIIKQFYISLADENLLG